LIGKYKTIQPDHIPGPGKYEPKLLLKRPPTAKIGSEKRSTEKALSMSFGPGPGNYKIPCTFANVPRYSLHCERSEQFKFV